MANKIEMEIEVNAEIYKIALESKMIIEQFQKLLGVYTSTEALAKIAVLMREESEIEAELNKYKELVDWVYSIVSVNCTDVGEAHAGIQQAIEELRDNCPAVTNGVHLWCVNGFDETRLCKNCGIRR